MRVIGRITGAALLPMLLFAASAVQAQDKIDRIDMEAHAAFNMGDFDAAVRYWKQVLKLDPDDSTAWYNLGLALSQPPDSETDKAIACYTEAIRLNPTDLDSFERRSELYKGKGDVAKAAADHAEAIRLMFALQGEITEDWAREKAVAAERLDDHDLAIACWSAVLKLDPKDAAAWFSRGASYDQSGKADKALADYNEAIRLNPNNLDPNALRAELIKNRGPSANLSADRTGAIRLMFSQPAVTGDWARTTANEAERNGDGVMAILGWSTVLKTNPNDATALLNRAGDYERAGERDKAIADYSEAIRLDPKNADALQFRGQLYESAGDDAKAIDDYTAMIHLLPGSDIGYCLRARASLHHGDADKAIADAGDALHRNPDNPEARLLLAGAHAARGSYDKALDNYNQLIAAHPGYVDGYNACALLLATCPDAAIRDGAKALALAQKACGLSQWKDPASIAALAAAEAASGKWDAAVKHQTQALALAKSANADKQTTNTLAAALAGYRQKKPYADGKK